ncbi:MAG TPA: hypothetical protein RMH99_23940, partial [Sandaracinaceae bacterium LLY-WYZ-13_1]|nr:hypothetical protein [Sandaracinaceae bacterium LLY-WYZ-13_1]
ARGALSGPEPTAPAPQTPAPDTHAPPASDEPIPTRTMAELLVRQGHLARGHAILRELARRTPDDDATAALLTDVAARLTDETLRQRGSARLKRAGPPFVELVRTETGRGVVWRLDEAALARGRSLLGATDATTLTVRVVSIEAKPDHGVESRRADHPAEAASGWRRVDAPPTARVVVSVGLAADERFVSILHAAD